MDYILVIFFFSLNYSQILHISLLTLVKANEQINKTLKK